MHVKALIVENCGVLFESCSFLVGSSDFGSELFVQCLAWCKQNLNGGQKIIAHIITIFFFLPIRLHYRGFLFGFVCVCVCYYLTLTHCWCYLSPLTEMYINKFKTWFTLWKEQLIKPCHFLRNVSSSTSMHLVLKSHIMQNPVCLCFKHCCESQVCLQTHKIGEKKIPPCVFLTSH